VIPLKVDQPAQAQLYFDRGDGLREQDSSVRAVGPGQKLVEVGFPVPRACLTKLRFDPLTASGAFSIGQPRFEDSSGRVIATIPLSEISALHEIADLRTQNGNLVGVTVAGATDPQLELKLKGPLCIGPILLPWIEAMVVTALVLLIRRFTGTTARAHAS
jgi:hypothetical protein